MLYEAVFKYEKGDEVITKTPHILATFTALLVFLLPPYLAWPCAVCFGDPNADLTNGLNIGIRGLVGIVLLGQMLIGGLLFYWFRVYRGVHA